MEEDMEDATCAAYGGLGELRRVQSMDSSAAGSRPNSARSLSRMSVGTNLSSISSVASRLSLRHDNTKRHQSMRRYTANTVHHLLTPLVEGRESPPQPVL